MQHEQGAQKTDTISVLVPTYNVSLMHKTVFVVSWFTWTL